MYPNASIDLAAVDSKFGIGMLHQALGQIDILMIDTITNQ